VTPRHIAIVGGGYSGTLQAINLLRHSQARVTLIERADRLARGVAYSTPHADHLLNVRAGRMSAFADAPDHFATWWGDAAGFAERRAYGSYLEDLLQDAARGAGDRLQILKNEAVAVTRGDADESVHLSGGGRLQADIVILSIGNLPPEVPRGISGQLPDDVYVADPWSGDIAAGLEDGDRLLLVGTGLTAVDAALILDSAGFKGKTLALSRRGLVPRAHDDAVPPVPALPEPPEGALSGLVRSVRRQGERIGWQAAVDQLRPHTQPLWASASVEQRRRFLRHLRPWWDVHRHRIAPEIAARIAAMERAGRLRFAAGKLVSAEADGAGALVQWRPRGEARAETLHVRRIVNCTGPQGDISRAGEPLLTQLSEAGRIRPDPCRIGIDIDERCRTLDADGEPSASLYAIGPMTRGALWEIVAVPDLRVQTDALARRLGGA